MIKMETGLIHAQDWRGYSLQIKIVLAKIELFQFQKALWMRCLKALKKNFLWKMGCITAIQQTDQRYIKSCISKLRKNDRLAAGYTLEEYERQYWQAFTDAVKVADPKWEAGKPIMPGVLDRITSKSIDALLVKSGSQLIRKSFERMI